MLFIKGRMDVAEILQNLGYKVISTTLPNFFAIESLFQFLDCPPLYPDSLLLRYEDTWDSSIPNNMRNTSTPKESRDVLNFSSKVGVLPNIHSHSFIIQLTANGIQAQYDK